MNTRSGATIDAPLALIYKGPGSRRVEDGDVGESGYGCSEASADAARLAGYRHRFVGPEDLRGDSTDEEVSALFSGARVWIQPGGKSDLAYAAMTDRLKNALVEFVKKGGGYVGFCAGAFLATDWFELLPGSSEALDYSTAREDVDYAFLPVKWNGQSRSVYFEGGPYFYDLDSSVEVTAKYSNGTVAAAKSTHGKGRVYIAGPHPEAPSVWSDEDRIEDPDGNDLHFAAEMIRWAGE